MRARRKNLNTRSYIINYLVLIALKYVLGFIDTEVCMV